MINCGIKSCDKYKNNTCVCEYKFGITGCKYEVVKISNDLNNIDVSELNDKDKEKVIKKVYEFNNFAIDLINKRGLK